MFLSRELLAARREMRKELVEQADKLGWTLINVDEDQPALYKCDMSGEPDPRGQLVTWSEARDQIYAEAIRRQRVRHGLKPTRIVGAD